MKNISKLAPVLAICLIFLLSGCVNPDRWKHVDIEQVSATGETTKVWEDVEILVTGGGIFGTPWVRFKTRDGKQATIYTPHNFIYR